MNSLAEVHLRQARAFLRAGDAQRAIELLEKARALARDDPQMLPEILDTLGSAYQATGATDKAAKCLAQRGGSGRAGAGVHAQAPIKSSRMPRWVRWFAATAAIILLAIGVIIATHHKPPAPTASAPTTQSTTSPATRILAAAIAPARAISATTRSVAATALPAHIDVRPNVALLVLLGHYEGLANGQHLQVYVPLSSAGAFVVTPGGVLLTVRHLTHLTKENNFPSTLQSLKLPTVTLRDISFVACFGPASNDWIDARLLYESEQYDLAILRTDRHFPTALDCTGRDAARREMLHIWTYPAVLTFDNRYTDAARIEEMIQNLPQTQSANLLSAAAPECFTATSTAGAVTIPERNVDGTACVELAAKPANDNGGGPMVDTLGRVIAIAEPAAKPTANAVGILVNQLQDEIAPYLGPARTSASTTAMKHNPKSAYN